MTLKTWFHLFLHVGCVALLLVQARRIQQIQKLIGERLEVEATKRTLRDRIVKTNYLKQGFSGAGAPGPLRWRVMRLGRARTWERMGRVGLPR
jgi:hypothetical protein